MLCAGAVLLLGVYQAALTAIYSAVVYRYAETAETPAAFERGLLEVAFQPKV